MRKSTGRDAKTGQFVKGNKLSLTKGTDVFIRTGKIPSEIRGGAKIKKDLVRIRGELEKMLGAENLNVKSELLLDQVVSSTGFLKLFEVYIKKFGLMNPQLGRKRIVSYQPGFTTYLSFMNKQREALQALNLEDRLQEKIISPLEVAKEIDATKSQDTRSQKFPQ